MIWGWAIARHLIEIPRRARFRRAAPGKRSRAPCLRSSCHWLVSILETADSAPAAKAEEEAANARRLKSHQLLAGLHVLLVDDDQDTLDLLSAALTQRSAKVTAVSSAAAAFESIKSFRPDVLISDIAMPVEDGYILIERVLALEIVAEIPALAITAYAKQEDKERALAAGYQRYLSKPVELGEFISAVAELARMEYSRS